MVTKNQMGVIKNYFQGESKKVLCVCSAGCLRSPTAAEVLSQSPYFFNTRSAGTYDEIAIVPVTDTLLLWADEIVCMDSNHTEYINKRLQKLHLDTPFQNLRIPDDYEFRNPELIQLIKDTYKHG